MKTKVNLLVAEDEPEDVSLLKRALKKAATNFDSQFVKDGGEVLEYVSGKGRFANRESYPLPEMLLLDLKMPKLGGFDVLKWLRAQPDGFRIVVIILSGSDDQEDVSRAYAMGANSYIHKTSNPE